MHKLKYNTFGGENCYILNDMKKTWSANETINAHKWKTNINTTRIYAPNFLSAAENCARAKNDSYCTLDGSVFMTW